MEVQWCPIEFGWGGTGLAEGCVGCGGGGVTGGEGVTLEEKGGEEGCLELIGF